MEGITNNPVNGNGADKFTSFVDWIKQLWDKVDIKGWAENVGGSSAQAMQAAIYFGIGFAVGFLLKKYFKFLFFSILVVSITILLLEYNNVLEINWKALNVLMGFEPLSDIGILINSLFDWIKAHMVTFVSCTVGFLVGYKLG